MLLRKTFMQLCLFILHGVMLHLDGICYTLHAEMICNDDFLCKMLINGLAFGMRIYRCLKFRSCVVDTKGDALGLQGFWFTGYGLRLAWLPDILVSRYCWRKNLARVFGCPSLIWEGKIKVIIMANDDSRNLLGQQTFMILCLCTLYATIRYRGSLFKHFKINVKNQVLFKIFYHYSRKFQCIVY